MDYKKIERSARTRKTVIRTVTYIFLAVWALLVLFPFYWMVLTSFKSYGAYNSEWIPQMYTDIYIRDITNFRTAFSGGRYRSKSVPTDEQAKNNDAIIALSGDFYSLKSEGLVIRNGEVYRTELSDWDVCVLFKDGTMKTYTPDEAEAQMDEILASDPWQSWCFGPKLLKNGEIMTEFNTSVGRANPRAAIGYYGPGHYCFVAVDGRQGDYSRGLTMEGMSQLMKELGCAEAYNLDGGQTSMMALYGETYNKPYNGGRGVSDILYIAADMMEETAETPAAEE